VTTNPIHLRFTVYGLRFSICSNRQPEIKNQKSKLRYPFVSEPAGPVKKQKFVYVSHHFLTIDSGSSRLPSFPFGGSLTGLLIGTTAAGQRNQTS
jgi:hypothetical protein